MTRGIPFLSPTQLASLQGLIDRGNATIEDFNRPQKAVQFRRFDKMLGRFADVGGPVTLVRLDFGLREGAVDSDTVIRREYADGELELHVGAFDLKNKDRFTFDGISMEVMKVFPQDQGTITAEVQALQQ